MIILPDKSDFQIQKLNPLQQGSKQKKVRMRAIIVELL